MSGCFCRDRDIRISPRIFQSTLYRVELPSEEAAPPFTAPFGRLFPDGKQTQPITAPQQPATPVAASPAAPALVASNSTQQQQQQPKVVRAASSSSTTPAQYFHPGSGFCEVCCETYGDRGDLAQHILSAKHQKFTKSESNYLLLDQIAMIVRAEQSQRWFQLDAPKVEAQPSPPAPPQFDLMNDEEPAAPTGQQIASLLSDQHELDLSPTPAPAIDEDDPSNVHVLDALIKQAEQDFQQQRQQLSADNPMPPPPPPIRQPPSTPEEAHYLNCIDLAAAAAMAHTSIVESQIRLRKRTMRSHEQFLELAALAFARNLVDLFEQPLHDELEQYALPEPPPPVERVKPPAAKYRRRKKLRATLHLAS